jgi:hypothetical protein
MGLRMLDWIKSRRPATRLREFLASDAARMAKQRVDAAREAPVFAEDDCTFDRSCTTLAWLTLHRIESLRAIDLAARGEVADSTLLLRDLIRMDAAHLASARSWISVYNRALTLRVVNERFEHRYRSATEHDILGALGGGERPSRSSAGGSAIRPARRAWTGRSPSRWRRRSTIVSRRSSRPARGCSRACPRTASRACERRSGAS